MFVAGDPSAKDLEKLLSLDSLFSQGSQSSSSSSSSSSAAKRGSSKQVRRKSSDRRGPSDSPHAHKKDNPSKPLETKDGRSSRIKEAAAAATEAAGDAKIHNPDSNQDTTLPKVAQETAEVKLHKPESRKAARREAPGPEHEAGRKQESEHEQEERRRRRRSDVTESLPPSHVKYRTEPRHLEKTVSIRLVDIRNSESDDFFLAKGMIRRNAVSSLDVASNTKFNKAAVVSDAKANGWLRRTQADAANGPAAGHLRSWGKFRIPKRSEKPAEEAEPRKPLLRPLTNTPEPSYPRTRLRTGMESDEYAPDSKADDGELETLKRCHSHQLRGDSSLGRRYGSDIIRRGVLAS